MGYGLGALERGSFISQEVKRNSCNFKPWKFGANGLASWPLGEALPLCPRSPLTLSFDSMALLRWRNFYSRKGEKYSSEVEKTLPGGLCSAESGLRQYAGGTLGAESGGFFTFLGHLLSADTGPLNGLSQEFRMLMASTSACYKLFREKQKEGHGEAIMFKGECPQGLGREQGAEPPERPLGGQGR